jgi:N-acetylneuraminic acid mutarotase
MSSPNGAGTAPLQFVKDPSSTGLHYKYTYVSAGTEAQDVDLPILVDLEDEAGNAASGLEAGKARFDFGKPSLVSESVNRVSLTKGTYLEYTFTASKPLGTAPSVELVDSAGTRTGMEPGGRSGQTYTYTYKVKETDAEGDRSIRANLKDMAGNEAADLGSMMVLFDFVAPSLLKTISTDKNPAYYKEGEKITITFLVNKDLGENLPIASLGVVTPLPLPCTMLQTLFYGCTMKDPLNGAEYPENRPVTVTVSLADLAGNTGYGGTSVILDFRKPDVNAHKVNPPKAGREMVVVYTVEADEALGEDPKLTTTPALVMNGPSRSGNLYSWTYEVSPEDPVQTYAVEIDMKDLAGNERTGRSLTPFSMDPVLPEITAGAVTSDNAVDNKYARDKAVIRAAFTVDKNPAENPVVTIDGEQMSFVSKNGTGPFQYVYDREVRQVPDTAGLKTVLVELKDDAGNIAKKDIGSVTYDFTPPALSGTASVSLVAPPDSLVKQVKKMGVGASAQVLFGTNEILGKNPDVELDPSSGTWAVTQVVGGGVVYLYELKLTGGSPAQAAYKVKAKLTDLAGNESDKLEIPIPANAVTVDTEAPKALTLEQNDKILYTRLPWGRYESASPASSGIPRYRVRTLDGEIGAVESNATVFIWDNSDVSKANAIGTVKADGSGYFPEKELTPSDRPVIYLTQVDEAGNHDPLSVTKLRNVEWTASMWHKVAGSIIENSNIMTTCSRLLPTLEQGPDCHEPMQGELDGMLKTEPVPIRRSAEGSWMEYPVDGVSPIRNGQLVYDTARGKTVMYYGENIIWEWDQETKSWSSRAAQNPPGFNVGTMAYDNSTGRILMFGGIDTTNSRKFFQETWELDPVSGSWKKLVVKGLLPAARVGHSMVYDSIRRRMVMFGGYVYIGFDVVFFNDLWEFDSSSNAWVQRVYQGDNPSKRYGMSMVYDSSHARAVMFGGGGYDSFHQDIWEWDGETGSWSNRTPATGDVPSPRYAAAMAYDSNTGKVILFSGITEPFTGLRDTWEWDGNSGTWLKIEPAGVKPDARIGASMVYDSARSVMVLFGGLRTHEPYEEFSDTWNWNSVKALWVDVTPDGRKPGITSDHAMAYDVVQGAIYMFGGTDGQSDSYGFWQWNGATGRWKKFPDNGNPSARTGASMEYDGNDVILFGGRDNGKTCSSGTSIYCNDMWRWNSTAETWGLVSPAGIKPDPRTEHAMAFDSIRGKMVLFGGDGHERLFDTWEWDRAANSWTNPITQGSTTEPHHIEKMAFDMANGKTVLFGGGKPDPGKYWEWKPQESIWDAKIPLVSEPTWTRNHSMAYDSSRRKIVVFGGGEYGGTNDIWELDVAGGTWIDRRPVHGEKPPPRTRHAMAYDSLKGRMVIFGGSTEGGKTRYNDIWEWNGGAQETAALIVQVPFSKSSVTKGAELKMFRADFSAGGEGYPEAVASKGALIKTWVENGWVARTANSNGPDAPGPVNWITEDQSVINRMIFGPEQIFYIAVTPAAVNGTGTGRIAADDVNVTIRYRISDDVPDAGVDGGTDGGGDGGGSDTGTNADY